MSTEADKATCLFVRARARLACEYCCAWEPWCAVKFHLEHVIPRSSGGASDEENLALACPACNAAKGAKMTGLDPRTGATVRLFHPRRDTWHEHFTWGQGLTVIVGRTAVGRATVVELDLNADSRLTARKLWVSNSREYREFIQRLRRFGRE